MAAAVVASDQATDKAIAHAALVVIRSADKSPDLTLNDEVGTANRAKWTKILAKKAVPTTAILARDEPKVINAVIPEPPAAAYGERAAYSAN
jgi:hypothetical protein